VVVVQTGAASAGLEQAITVTPAALAARQYPLIRPRSVEATLAGSFFWLNLRLILDGIIFSLCTCECCPLLRRERAENVPSARIAIAVRHAYSHNVSAYRDSRAELRIVSRIRAVELKSLCHIYPASGRLLK
jgi:hypothetical protein